jgi:glycosyltransferase involved in cell wall biosynthesis
MKKIKVAIIAHSGRMGGGLVGTVNMLKAFKNVAEDEQFFVVCSAGCGYEEIELPQGSEVFIYKGSHSYARRYWFETVELPRVVGGYKPDVIFGIGNTGLTHPNAPQALFIRQGWLVYDKKHYPDMPLRLRLRLAALKSQIKKSLPATNLIFCQTPIVKCRFSDRFCYTEDRISILRFPPPVEIAVNSHIDIPAVLDKYSGNFYVLLLTRYMPHRNPNILIPLCQHYGSQIREKRIKFIATVEERDHPQARVFLRKISSYHLEDVIINVGRLSREDVLRYLMHSDALWLPTLVETLCLPYLEAMCCGIPILAPDLDFARYVCGEAALFYDPWNLESIYKKIVSLRENPSLRRELITKGRMNLTDTKRFAGDWTEVASDVLVNLRNILCRQ